VIDFANQSYEIQEEVGEEEAFFAYVLCGKGVDKNDIPTSFLHCNSSR